MWGLSAPICADICGSFHLSFCGCSAEKGFRACFLRKISFWLFCGERLFLTRDLRPVLSTGCNSEPLGTSNMGKLLFFVNVTLCWDRVGYPSEKVYKEGTSRGDKDAALFSVPEGQFVWYLSILYSSAASKVIRHLKHSPADPYELSFVQFPVKQVLQPKSAPAQQ